MQVAIGTLRAGVGDVVAVGDGVVTFSVGDKISHM